MFDEAAPSLPPQSPKPSAPPRPPSPVSTSVPAPSSAKVEDMFDSVPGGSSVPTGPAPAPGVPQSMKPSASAPMSAPISGGGAATAIKVVIAFIVIVGLIGGTVYFLNARSQAAKKNLPPVAPTEGMLDQTPEPTPTPTPQPTPTPTPEPTPSETPSPALPARDTDSDGLSDDQERTFGTDPTSADTDGDGLTDYEEVINYGTNPLRRDTDEDSLSDFEEVKTYKSDPKKSDTDGDSYSDKTEVDNGYDPAGPGKLQQPTVGADFDAKFKVALENQMNVYGYAKDESKNGAYYFIADRQVSGQWQSVIWVYDVANDSQWKTVGTISVAAGSSVVLSQSSRGNDTLDPQWRTAGITDNKFVFASTPVDDSPGPCFSPWRYSSLFYIDLGVANPIQKPYTLTAQDEARAQAESDACMKTLP